MILGLGCPILMILIYLVNFYPHDQPRMIKLTQAPLHDHHRHVPHHDHRCDLILFDGQQFDDEGPALLFSSSGAVHLSMITTE